MSLSTTPLPKFTVVGDMFEIATLNDGTEITPTSATSAVVTFVPNFDHTESPVTCDGDLHWVRPVIAKVTPSGQVVSKDGNPVLLLADDPRLNVEALQWSCHIKLRERYETQWWFDAAHDGEVIDLGSVTRVPGETAQGVIRGPRGYSPDDVQAALGDTAAQFYVQGQPIGDPLVLPSAAWGSILGKPDLQPLVDGAAQSAALRLETLKASAAVWSDLLNDNHIHAGGRVVAPDRPVSVSTPSVVTPGATNLLAGILPLTGGTTGTLGSGGALPTGLVRNNNSAVKVLHAVDGDGIDMTYNTQSGTLSCGGFSIDVAPPAAGAYLLSFVVDCIDSNTDSLAIMLRAWHPVNGNGAYMAQVAISDEKGSRRVVARITFASTAERALVQIYGLRTTDVGKYARFVLSDFMMIAETTPLPLHDGVLSMPPYGQEAAPASDITMNIPNNYAGEHVVLAKTVERGWLVERAALTAGSNSLSNVFHDASITVNEVAAIPFSTWRPGDLDVICPPEYQSVGWRWIGDGTLNGYRRSYSDTSAMLGQPVSPSLGTQGTELPYAYQMGRERNPLHRFEIYENDRNVNPGVPGTVDRCEIVHGTYLPANTDVWISFWVRMSEYSENAMWNNLMQIRYHESSGSNLSPELSFGPYYTPGYIAAVLRSDGGTPASPPQTVGTNVFWTTTPGVTYEPDQWYHVVLLVNLSTSGGGHFGWWWDGQEIYDSDVPIGYNRYAAEPPLIHHGMYRQNSSVHLVVDFQHYEVSTSSLAHRITAPLPI